MRFILGLYGDIGILEKKMETTGVIGGIWGLQGIYWGSMGIMEKKMETITYTLNPKP